MKKVGMSSGKVISKTSFEKVCFALSNIAKKNNFAFQEMVTDINGDRSKDFLPGTPESLQYYGLLSKNGSYGANVREVVKSFVKKTEHPDGFHAEWKLRPFLSD